MITEPRWKSYMVETKIPLFTPKQCQMIINAGRSEPRQDGAVGNDKGDGGSGVDTETRTSHISWIPFNKTPEMYKDIEKVMKTTNGNHFGFDGMQITEQAQYTEYPEGGFYDWHIDSDTNFAHEPTVRKISMTLLLNHPSEFEGGDLELMSPGKSKKLEQGHAITFASFLNHRVAPVTRGVRQSLVVWFGGKPFR